MVGFWDTVASAGPYANNLHLAQDRQPHLHFITQFYTLDAVPDAQLTVSNTEGRKIISLIY